MPGQLSMLLVILLLPALLQASVAKLSIKQQQQQHHQPQYPTCQSVECVSLAAEIASRMNASADPCQDFYNFACGNFANIVKYSPLKASSMSRLSPSAPQDFLLEDTIGLMTEKLEKSIYEMLVLERVVTSPDPDMADLYNVTRVFFSSCRQWLQARDRSAGSQDPIVFYQFFHGVYQHLSQTIRETPVGEDAVSVESIFAALVKAGGNGLLQVELPRFFTSRVVLADDYNLTRTPRAGISVAGGLFGPGGTPRFDRVVEFLTDAYLQPWELSVEGKSATLDDIYAALTSALSARPSLQNCTINASQSSFTLQELDQLTACHLSVSAGLTDQQPFSWSRFFEELLQAPVDPAATVEVENPAEVLSLVAFFKARPVYGADVGTRRVFSDHVTFLIVDWLMSFAAFLPSDLRGDWTWQKTLVLPVEKDDGVQVCMRWTKTLLQPIVERMYQTAYYHRQDFRDIQELVQLIQEASVDSVRRQQWLSDSAKDAIVRKVRATKQSIGLEELTAGQLKEFYNATLLGFRHMMQLPQRLEQSFGSLLALALCSYVKKNFDVMSGYSPVTMFLDVNPLVVNAFNYIEKNQIIFPMAILAPPIYHRSYPDYINIGSLGYIIGHEIGHSFDNIGHNIDTLGAWEHFWDNRTEASYLERVECVRASYGRFRLYPDGPSHLSNTTIGNDIADIIGIRAATQALKLLRSRQGRGRGVAGKSPVPMKRLPNLPGSLTPVKLLFIQAAQSWCIKSEPHILELLFGERPSHSPHHLRVQGIAQNSPEFAAAFRCARDAPMNPAEKCTFW